MMIRRMIIAAGLTTGLVAGVAVGAPAAEVAHPTVVSDNPSDATPHLVADAAVGHPRVLDLAQRDDTIFAGGIFGHVSDPQRQTTRSRSHLFAFDAQTGEISESFAPEVDDSVWSVLAVGDWIYIGGEFDTVNGVSSVAMARLDAETGELDPTFDPPFRGGRVTDMAMVNGYLVASGTFPRKLVALRTSDGRGSRYIQLDIDGKVPNSSGKTEVFRFAVDPAREHLVGVGNFTSVAGQERARAFRLDLGETSATLSPWWYPPFAKKCASNSRSRQAYLEDVDFSPDGSYFVFVSTGYVPTYPWEIGTMVCDAAARFETDVTSPSEPTWINYTGGDTLHSVEVTGSAVYVQGHSRWLDNPYGRDSAGPGAVDRRGGGAIDPVTGDALPWNPRMPNRIGGFDFLATSEGLWIGRDGRRIGGEYHRGLAFMPLP